MTWEEHEGDLWDVSADAIVITTNGVVRADGAAVMGRGCAKEAADRFPALPYKLGKRLEEYGNIPFLFEEYDRPVITLPVKHHWRGPALMELIGRTLPCMVSLVGQAGYLIVAMPRPGCGNGRLPWEFVKPSMDYYLSETVTRFIVCHK